MVALAISGCIEKQTEVRYIQVTPQPAPKEAAPPEEPRFGAECPPQPAFTDNLNDAQADYNWRASLLNEQQGRLDTLYAVKSGVMMKQREYKGWLDDLRASLLEYHTRRCYEINSANNYIKQLNANKNNLNADFYKSEMKRIQDNYDIVESDIDKNIAAFDGNIEKYNNCFVYKTGC